MSEKGWKLYNKAENPKLKNHIKELYRPGATIGDGGTADALGEKIEPGQELVESLILLKQKSGCRHLKN